MLLLTVERQMIWQKWSRRKWHRFRLRHTPERYSYQKTHGIQRCRSRVYKARLLLDWVSLAWYHQTGCCVVFPVRLTRVWHGSFHELLFVLEQKQPLHRNTTCILTHYLILSQNTH